jgi:hypothetical protein
MANVAVSPGRIAAFRADVAHRFRAFRQDLKEDNYPGLLQIDIQWCFWRGIANKVAPQSACGARRIA